MARNGYKFDGKKFIALAHRLGYGSYYAVAEAAGVSVRTVRRTALGEELPSAVVLLWAAEVGIDLRKVWVPQPKPDCEAA